MNDVVSIQVGKNGLTAGLYEEIKRQLKQKGEVQVKCLPAFMKEQDKNAVLEELLANTGARLVKKRGFVFDLAKPLKKQTSQK